MIYLLAIAIFTAGHSAVSYLDTFNSRPYITPTESPGTALWINWNTLNPESTIVAYGPTTDLEDTVRGADVAVYHHVRLSGLTAGASYYYRLLPAGELAFFQTAAATADSFYFLTIGDTRTDSIAHQSLINRMVGYEDPFFLHVGDLVEDGSLTINWQTFFNIEDTILPHKIFLPAIGNHEYPYEWYDTLFPLPDSEDYYSFTYANCHFIGLNTETDLSGSQLTWLVDDLIWAQANPAIDWIIAFFHRPPYSSGPHGSQADVQAAWCPVFELYDMDLVFAGHDHDYERTYPINGLTYIVTGGGGAPLHSVGSNSWTAYAESTYEFCRVLVRGLRLELRAIKPDGTVFDSLIIEKPIGRHESDVLDLQALVVRPNPFIHELNISLVDPSNADFAIRIFDHQGRLVRTIRGQNLTWLGDDDDGRTLPAGVYFLDLDDGRKTSMMKVVKLRS